METRCPEGAGQRRRSRLCAKHDSRPDARGNKEKPVKRIMDDALTEGRAACAAGATLSPSRRGEVFRAVIHRLAEHAGT